MAAKHHSTSLQSGPVGYKRALSEAHSGTVLGLFNAPRWMDGKSVSYVFHSFRKMGIIGTTMIDMILRSVCKCSYRTAGTVWVLGPVCQMKTVQISSSFTGFASVECHETEL